MEIDDYYGTTDVGPCPYDDCDGTRQKHNSTSTPVDVTTESCTECDAGTPLDGHRYERPSERREQHRKHQLGQTECPNCGEQVTPTSRYQIPDEVHDANSLVEHECGGCSCQFDVFLTDGEQVDLAVNEQGT